MSTKAFLIPLVIVFFILYVQQGNAQKTDTIYHTNGNVLTGDFKKLNYGVVKWSMSGMGTITYEVPEISNIKSDKQFEVKLKNGLLYFGSFDTTGVDRKVKLILANGSQLLNIDDIVEVYPIKKSFWLRTTGNFSLGFNYSKGSDVASFVFSGNMYYRKRKSSLQLSWNNNNTFQADTLSSTNISVGIGTQRTIKNYWSAGVAIGGTQNSELGVKLRMDITALGIRDIVYNQWNRYFVAAGLSVQRETPYDSDLSTSTDLAGIVTTVWKVYKYTNPKVWVDSDLSFIPYITGDWRYRVEFNLNPKVGIIGNDLQIGFNFYYSYDSRPPTTSTTTSFDYGINFEVTYSLH